MTEKKDINELQVNAWRVIEALAERQYDLASVEELAGDVGISVPQTRRILATWDHLGIVETRGTMYRLTEVLAESLPHTLRLALREKFFRMETMVEIPQVMPHVDINVGQETSPEKIGIENPSHQEEEEGEPIKDVREMFKAVEEGVMDIVGMKSNKNLQ